MLCWINRTFVRSQDQITTFLTISGLPWQSKSSKSPTGQPTTRHLSIAVIDSIFKLLMNVPLRCPDYTCISKRAKSVNVRFKTPIRGGISHLVIDSTGLKVFGEGEWKVNNAASGENCIWPWTPIPTRWSVLTCLWTKSPIRKHSRGLSGRLTVLRRKNIKVLIPPRARACYWSPEYADRNQTVARQRLTVSNAYWKWSTSYNCRSIAETAMYRVKNCSVVIWHCGTMMPSSGRLWSFSVH